MNTSGDLLYENRYGTKFSKVSLKEQQEVQKSQNLNLNLNMNKQQAMISSALERN